MVKIKTHCNNVTWRLCVTIVLRKLVPKCGASSDQMDDKGRARRVKPKGSNSYARTDYGLALLHITFAECKRDKRNVPNVIVTLRINKDRLQMQHHLDAIGHSETTT